MSKTLRQYIAESQKIYEFKIKIAGDCPEESTTKIKEALVQFGVDSCEQIMRTPIQETHFDFPEHKNVNVTVFNVALEYPTTSEQIRNQVADILGKSQSCVKVRNTNEEREMMINHQFDKKSESSVLLQDYPKENNQNLVGDKQKTTLLKSLNKEKHAGIQYKGVNDQILNKKSPVEKLKEPAADINSISPIGSKINNH